MKDSHFKTPRSSIEGVWYPDTSWESPEQFEAAMFWHLVRLIVFSMMLGICMAGAVVVWFLT
jgi:uncharacterized membrane protein